MLTECKCGNPVEAKLNVDTNKVICQNCNTEISNISDFAKARMKTDGDVVKHVANTIPKGGMQVECNICHKNIVALLNKNDNKCYCSLCKNEVILSPFSIALLRENGQYVGNIREDRFVGDDLDLNNENENIVQIDENGQIEVVKLGSVDAPASPVELLEARNKAIADADAKSKNESVQPKRKRGRPRKNKI